MSGWIKLQRDIMDHWIAQDNEYLAVWVRMLAEANFCDRKTVINGALVEVKRGQLIFGLESYSDKTKVSVRRLRKLLDLLESDGMIDRQKTNKFSLISIVNYDKHQGDDKQESGKSQSGVSQESVKGQAEGNTIRNKEIKNRRKISKSTDFEPSAKLTFAQKCFEVFWKEVEKKGTGKAEALKVFEKYTAGKTDDEVEYILNVICHWYELYLQEDESRLLPENKKYLKSAAAWLNSAPWRADPQAYAEFKQRYYEASNEAQPAN